MRTYQDAKAMAKSLRASLDARGLAVSHSECLEIVAQQFGFADWNILAAKLSAEGSAGETAPASLSLQPPIPVLKVASLEEAKRFYVGFLGFRFDWGYEEGSTFGQVTRSNVTFHLNAESRLTGSTGMLVRMNGLDGLHRELSESEEPFTPSAISFTPWDSRVFHVVDPFGNAIQFWENNPPGVAKSL